MNDHTQALGAYTAVVSVVMPLIVAVVVQSHWRKELKGAVALAACLIAGIGSVFITGTDIQDLAVVIPLVLVASQTSYHTFWKPTGLVPNLEAATDLQKGNQPTPAPSGSAD
jgi:hypothetical protein